MEQGIWERKQQSPKPMSQDGSWASRAPLGVQPPTQSRVTCSGLPRSVSGQVLKSSKDGAFTIPLDNLCQCLTILRGKCFFLWNFKWNCLCFTLCPVSLAFHWATLRRVWLRLLYSVPITYLHKLIRCPFSRLHSLSGLSLSLYGRTSKPLVIFMALLWT